MIIHDQYSHDTAREQHQTTKKAVLFRKGQIWRNVFVQSMAEFRLKCLSV